MSYEIALKRFPGCITGPHDRGRALVFEIVLHDLPGQLVGELKSFDQPLLFNIREWPLLAEFYGFSQLQQCLLIMTEPLPPADVGIGNVDRLFRM